MPRLNSKNSPGATKKFSNIVLNQDSNFFTVDMYAWKPLLSSSGGASDEGGIKITEYQNVLNTRVKDDANTFFQVPLVSNDRISSADGTIKVKILGGGEKPLETQLKGSNTLSWLETIETLEIEISGVYNPSDYLDMFSFEDIRENVSTSSFGSLKKTNTKIFYVSNAEPIVDNLTEKNTVTATRVTLTAGITSLLQNENTNGLLTIEYLVEPVQPANAKFAKITYASYMLHNGVSGVNASNATPLTIQRVSELNKETFLDGVESANRNNLTSDEMIIDGVYPKTINGKQANLSSWMSGEIYNKIRIWNELNGDNVGDKGYVGRGWLQTSDDTGFAYFTKGGDVVDTNRVEWKGLLKNREYALFTAGTLPLEFDNEILGALGSGGESPITPWYNSFSFFENLYQSKGDSDGAGNGNTFNTNAFFTFDAQRAQVGSPVGNVPNLQEFLVISNPNDGIVNPNFTEEDYDNYVNDAVTGTVTINGTTFSAWDPSFEQINKPDNIYDWDNTEENRKYIVVTPGNDYVSRMNKIISSGGKTSADSNSNVVVGKTQISGAVQPFPTGAGSQSFIYPNNIFFSQSYCNDNGWPTNNKVVVSHLEESRVQEVTLDHWGGELITIEFFDGKGNPAIGFDQDQNPVQLPPTTVKAANQDASGNPLKTRTTIIFGFSAA